MSRGRRPFKQTSSNYLVVCHLPSPSRHADVQRGSFARLSTTTTPLLLTHLVGIFSLSPLLCTNVCGYQRLRISLLFRSKSGPLLFCGFFCQNRRSVRDLLFQVSKLGTELDHTLTYLLPTYSAANVFTPRQVSSESLLLRSTSSPPPRLIFRRGFAIPQG